MKSKLVLKNIQTNNHLLKLLSVIFGYAFWVMLAQLQIIELKLKIPLSFYGLQNNLKINTQENVNVQLAGKRMNFYDLDISKLAAHINLENIKNEGKYNINLLPENIFLHNKIKLLNYDPTNIWIEIQKDETNLS